MKRQEAGIAEPQLGNRAVPTLASAIRGSPTELGAAVPAAASCGCAFRRKFKPLKSPFGHFNIDCTSSPGLVQLTFAWSMGTGILPICFT